MAQSAGEKVKSLDKTIESDLRMSWDCIKVYNTEERDGKLYSALRHLLTQQASTSANPKAFFVNGASSSLLNVLSVPHSPQVYILALSLLGFFCDCHPEQRLHILRKGLVTDLTRLLRNHCFKFAHNLNQPGASHNYLASSELVCKISEFLLLLSQGPIECIEALVFNNIIIDLVHFINPQNGHLFAFSPKSAQHLKKLTVKKDLIGHCLPMSSDVRSGEYLRLFGEACCDIVLPQVALDVDLYDTQDPDRDVLIREELMEQSDEYKWWKPVDSFLSLADNLNNEEAMDWADIRVTHVVDGQFFWARTRGEEGTETAKHIAKTLAEWPENLRQSVPPFVPAGTFVVATDKERTYRCQVLSSNGDRLTLFAVDYGFIDSLPLGKVFLLTPEMKLKMKPLAVLCRLHGASPPPFNKSALKNFLSVLQNLTRYNMTDSRAQFCSSEPWVSFQPLLKTNDAEIVSAVLNILTSLTQHKQVAAMMASDKLFSFLLSFCPVPCNCNSQAALTILHHLLYNSEEAKDTFSRCRGPEHLVRLLLSKPPDAVQKSVNHVLSAFVSIAKGLKQTTSPSPGPTPELIVLRARKELEQSSGVSQKWKSRCHNRHSNPVPENGIRKAVDLNRHSSVESEDENKFSNLSGGDTEPEMLLTSSKEKGQVVPVEVSEPCDPLAKMVFLGEKMNVQVDSRTELITYRDAKMVPGSLVAKLACSFLNSGPTGVIYLGLNARSEAFGVELLRKERDETRVGMDHAMNQLFPPLTSSQYKIIFHPIYHNITKVAPNLFVLELRLKSTEDILYSVRGNVYLREKQLTYKCQSNDIHEHFVRVEEEDGIQEILELEQEVGTLSRILNGVNAIKKK